MTTQSKLIATTLLLAITQTATAQMSRAPALPGPPPVPSGPSSAITPSQAPLPPPPVRTIDHVQRFGRFSSDQARSLVIPSADSEGAANLTQIGEDLNIMSRILEKALNLAEDPIHLAMGITLEGRFFGNTTMPKNMYLEGYGALLMLNVPFPLAPANAQSGGNEPKADPNTEWDAARRELQSGVNRSFGLDLSNLSLPRPGAAQPYDEAKLNEMKDNIINALRNAVNIRALRPDELITVVITGARPEGSPTPPRGLQGPDGSAAPAPPAAPASRMLFQVKRSDLEAFQKDKADLEALRKKVKVTLL